MISVDMPIDISGLAKCQALKSQFKESLVRLLLTKGSKTL